MKLLQMTVSLDLVEWLFIGDRTSSCLHQKHPWQVNLFLCTLDAFSLHSGGFFVLTHVFSFCSAWIHRTIFHLLHSSFRFIFIELTCYKKLNYFYYVFFWFFVCNAIKVQRSKMRVVLWVCLKREWVWESFEDVRMDFKNGYGEVMTRAIST